MSDIPALAPRLTAHGRSRGGLEPPPLPQVLEARRERRLATGFALLGVVVFALAAILNPYDEAGLPPGRFTADEVLKVMAFTGLGTAVIRWLVTLGCGLACA